MKEMLEIDPYAAKKGWNCREIKNLKGYTIESIEEDKYILSKRNELYSTSHLNDNPKKFCSFPSSKLLSLFSRFRLFQRFFRYLYYNVIPIQENTFFLSFNKTHAILRESKIFSLSGLKRPCRILRSGCALTPQSNLYFGEYLNNKERGAITIYCLKKNKTQLEPVFNFPKNSIRHVHGISYDPVTGKLWITTGDSGDECRILVTDEDFKNIEVIGKGDESWRCVSLCLTENAIYYATDSEFQQNYVYKIERKTGVRYKLGKIDGLVYYTFSTGEKIFFGVSAELNIGAKGSIHKSTHAALWCVDRNDNLFRIFYSLKDMYSPKFFMPGTIHFPHAYKGCSKLFVHMNGLKNLDNKTFEIFNS